MLWFELLILTLNLLLDVILSILNVMLNLLNVAWRKWYRWCLQASSTSAKWPRPSSGQVSKKNSRFVRSSVINHVMFSGELFSTLLAWHLVLALQSHTWLVKSPIDQTSWNSSVDKDKVQSDQVGGATSWRLAGLVPPFVSCIAVPILIIMKVDFPFLLVQPLIFWT